MPDYIEREALINHLWDVFKFYGRLPCSEEDKHTQEVIRRCIGEVKKQPAADVVEVPESGIGDLSDGYHTFNELYHHRAVLFSVICNSMPDRAWKSKLHDTGDMYDGMFIVGIETPQGQATYHYDIDPYWDMFKVRELGRAPRWDGHTPAEAIRRIAELSADVVEVRHGKWVDRYGEKYDNHLYECSVCKKEALCKIIVDELRHEHIVQALTPTCPHCGAKMDGKGEGRCN